MARKETVGTKASAGSAPSGKKGKRVKSAEGDADRPKKKLKQIKKDRVESTFAAADAEEAALEAEVVAEQELTEQQAAAAEEKEPSASFIGAPSPPRTSCCVAPPLGIPRDARRLATTADHPLRPVAAGVRFDSLDLLPETLAALKEVRRRRAGDAAARRPGPAYSTRVDAAASPPALSPIAPRRWSL